MSLKKEIEKAGGDAVVIGVPGAFSPACSAQMVPGYIRVRDQLPKNVFVLSVNDPFVSKVCLSFPGPYDDFQLAKS